MLPKGRRPVNGVTKHHSRVTNHGISNRYEVRIEIAVTYSKQRRATNSNRYKFRGLPAEAFRVCEGGVRDQRTGNFSR